MNYWILKTDPKTYSFDDLLRERETAWDGVRNYQARNNLKLMKSGDIALIYHSVDDKMLVGAAKVIKEYFPDPKDENWTAVQIEVLNRLERSVPLSEIKSNSNLENLPLIKQSRLSVMPISEIEYNILINMSENRI